MDPLQAAGSGGACGRLACLLAESGRARADEALGEAERHRRARARLASEGRDPDRTPWATVPWNPAPPVPLEPAAVGEFEAHLTRIVAAVKAAGEPPPDAAAAPPFDPDLSDAEARGLARACAACRGWCCRRGGTHAFLDEASLRRVARLRSELGPAEIVGLYRAHLGPTHLEGGCVFQGPGGCRLPRDLRSDTCNRWFCEDLDAVRARWHRGGHPVAETLFVPVTLEGTGPPR